MQKQEAKKQAGDRACIPVFSFKSDTTIWNWLRVLSTISVTGFMSLSTFYTGLFNAKHCPVFARVNQPTTRLIFGFFVSLIPCTVLADLMICKSENDHR